MKKSWIAGKHFLMLMKTGDFDSDMTYEKYRNITDKAHLKKIIQMPVNFLIKSGDGFFL